MDVSENSGTPNSSISIGISTINHPFGDTTIFGNTHIYIYIYIRVTSGPATSKRLQRCLLRTAPYHHDYSWLPLIWGIGHIQPVKAALINWRLFSRQLSPTAAKETAGRLQLDHWWSMHVFRIISSRCDLLTAEFEAMLCQKRGFVLLTLREQWTLAPRMLHDATGLDQCLRIQASQEQTATSHQSPTKPVVWKLQWMTWLTRSVKNIQI